MITTEAARILGNQLVLAKCVNRDYDEDFAIKGAKIGQSLNIRKPARYTARIGTVVDIQAQTETYAPLTFTNPIGVDLAFTSQEMTFSLDDFASRFIKPAIVRIANTVDAQGYALVNNSYMYVGTPGTALTSATARTAVLQAAAKLYDNDAPVDSGDLHFISGSDFNAVLSDSNASLFHPTKQVSDAYIKGMQGTFGGFEHYMGQAVPSRTNGVYGGSPTMLTTGTPQTGSSLSTVGWTATSTTLNVGDIFTIANVFGVNPQNYTNYKWLQPFTVTAATVTDGAGASVIQVSPAIVSSGPFQNVSAAPATSAAIVVIGASGASTQQAIGFHRDAIMLANQELVTPGNVEESSYIRDEQTNIGIRFASQWDIRTNQHIQRFDTMVAWASLYSQLLTRVFTN
jgi:uncharacterized protein (UPF0297 family)